MASPDTAGQASALGAPVSSAEGPEQAAISSPRKSCGLEIIAREAELQAQRSAFGHDAAGFPGSSNAPTWLARAAGSADWAGARCPVRSALGVVVFCPVRSR
ncbi:hypothetical protein GCM10010411_89610 [Actinomadura fulvescens]|uniref:Uncharacterized protein n=1 Tax=Actinomadura fulvescens TaxID=46160 RepID=A0ABN3QVK5_9ACTN